jgi:hypothetical protein
VRICPWSCAGIRWQPVARAEQVVEEMLRVADLASGDPLLELPYVGGDGLDVLLLAAGHSRDDRVGQLERCGWVQPTGLDPGQHRPGFAQRHLRVDGGVR